MHSLCSETSAGMGTSLCKKSRTDQRRDHNDELWQQNPWWRHSDPFKLVHCALQPYFTNKDCTSCIVAPSAARFYFPTLPLSTFSHSTVLRDLHITPIPFPTLYHMSTLPSVSVLRSGPVRSWTPFLGGPGLGPSWKKCVWGLLQWT